MARQMLGPRKQRTRQHVIADLSVHYLEGFILQEGHTPYRLTPDYGYDLVLLTYDERATINGRQMAVFALRPLAPGDAG